MSEVQKIAAAIVSVFVIGFIMVALNKQQSTEDMEAASMVRNYVAMQEMANQKCPAAIKKATNEQVYFPSSTDSDKESYVTMKWVGENSAQGGFKNASCTLRSSLGGISELVIDDKVIIKK